MSKLLKKAENVTRALFLVSVLTAFNSPSEAAMSLFCVLVHEGAHALGFLCHGGVGRFQTRSGGFLMTGRRPQTALGSLIVSSLGIAVNLLFAAVFYVIYKGGNERFGTYAVISLMTALTNALPLPGYDGGQILISAGSLLGLRKFCVGFVRYAGVGIAFLLVVTALFFIDRFALGYWIFFSFFFAFLSSLFQKKNRDSPSVGNP